jgi:hypothetical protein
LSCLRSSIGVSLRETSRNAPEGTTRTAAAQNSQRERGQAVRKAHPRPKFRKKFQMWTRPGKRSCPPFHWLLCDFQGPRRGGARRAAARDRSPASGRRRAGLSKLNSMGARPEATTFQIRSTSLVADQSSVHRGQLRRAGSGRTRKPDGPWLAGAPCYRGSLERR